MNFISAATSFQQRLKFVYRQPKPPLKLFIYIVCAQHGPLPIPIILSTNLKSSKAHEHYRLCRQPSDFASIAQK